MRGLRKSDFPIPRVNYLPADRIRPNPNQPRRAGVEARWERRGHDSDTVVIVHIPRPKKKSAML